MTARFWDKNDLIVVLDFFIITTPTQIVLNSEGVLFFLRIDVYNRGMDKSVKQLEDVRNAIQVNIESIKSLIEQANSLSEIITPIEDTDLRDKLSVNLQGIYSTIDNLIENTDKLFDELKEFAATTVS